MSTEEMIKQLQTIFDACLKSGLIHTLQDAEKLTQLFGELQKRLHSDNA